MSHTAARMVAYAEYLETYDGVRSEHETGGHIDCHLGDHCHIHNVDEPDNGDVHRSCLKCGHVFVTELDLQAADVRERTGAWQSQLRTQAGPLDHSGAPVARPVAEIDSCPLCTHSF